MSDIKIDSISQFVERLGEINRGKRAIYRGQRRERPLLPKLARLNTPISLLKAEQAMFDDFKGLSVPLLDKQPESDWGWLSLMQHHGLATRLLDWSVNPLVALWFAVNKPPAESHSGVLWVFQPDNKDYFIPSKEDSPFTLDRTRLVKPKVVTKRIGVGSQLGWFTAHHFNSELEQFIAVEQDPVHRPRLTKLIIPPEKFAQLRFQLDRLGVNAAMIFPDLDGLCAHLEWFYSYLADENDPNLQKTFLFEQK
ncbi:MAG: FRG domain-containing protein [Pleurocapsa sp. MO_192.B19]|nr:FRG domain-containing protein [Pleurocapsa sp. MO_192.B19]